LFWVPLSTRFLHLFKTLILLHLYYYSQAVVLC